MTTLLDHCTATIVKCPCGKLVRVVPNEDKSKVVVLDTKPIYVWTISKINRHPGPNEPAIAYQDVAKRSPCYREQVCPTKGDTA